MYFVALLSGLLAVAMATEMYPTKFDNLDVDEILKNERLLKSYFKCVMDRGSCTPEGAELRKHMPDALETECSKCSEIQRKQTTKIVKYFIEKKPDMYKELEEKFDPKGIYRERYRKKMAE